MNSKSNHKYILISILVASAAIQWILRPSIFVGPDTPKFLEIAQKQLQGNFWFNPSAFDGNYWSIGYPTFLAALKATVGTSTNTLQITHIVLGLILVLLTWLISSSLDSKVKIIATCLVAFNPALWALASLGGYEVLLGVVLVSATFLTWQLFMPIWWPTVERATLYRMALVLTSGVFLGIAVMIQSKSFILVLIFAIYWFRRSWLTAILGILGVLLVLLPWGLRNLLVLGSISPFNTNGPINVWIGNNPNQLTGGFMEPPVLPEGSGGFIDSAIKFTLSQPEFAAQLLLRKIVRLVEPMYFYFGDRQPSALQLSFHAIVLLIGIFILVGFLLYIAGRIWLSSPPLPPLGLIASTVAMFYLVNLPFIAESRFVAPLLPLATIISVSTFSSLLGRTNFRRFVLT
jgi:hypothetical protein